MTIEAAVVLCAACGKPITRVRMFYGHVERQPVGTVHYARPRATRLPDRGATAAGSLPAGLRSDPVAGRPSAARGRT